MSYTDIETDPAELAEFIADPSRGQFAIVGESGNLSNITGEVTPSSAMRGFYLIETEHGTLYIDEDILILVREF